jgi:hypothetical protein
VIVGLAMALRFTPTANQIEKANLKSAAVAAKNKELDEQGFSYVPKYLLTSLRPNKKIFMGWRDIGGIISGFGRRYR